MREGVKDLWRLCFDDTEEFIEMYFRLRYSDETTVTIARDGKIVSALQMPTYPMTLNGEVVRAAYISGACTHPDYRGKGLMTQLLHKAFEEMLRKDIPLSFLIPANASLYDYYARLGYTRAFFRTTVKETLSSFPLSETDACIEEVTAFDQQAFDYFTMKSYTRPNCVQHTEEDMRAVWEDLRLSDGGVTVAKVNNRIAGILFACPEGDTLVIKESFAEDNDIHRQLIAEAARRYKLSSIIRYTLPTHSPAEEAFGMLRVITPNSSFRFTEKDMENVQLYMSLMLE